MNSLHREIDALLTHPADRTALVFPSEIAAEFWRRSATLPGAQRAIREDRFVSWDRFKEEAFEIRESALPVNNARLSTAMQPDL